MTQFGKRKDGRHYPKKSVSDASKGMSRATFEKLREQDARRTPNARAIDNKIKAPIDHSGTRWKAQPNRYDVKGIDYPKSRNKEVDVGAFTIYPDDDFELIS